MISVSRIHGSQCYRNPPWSRIPLHIRSHSFSISLTQLLSLTNYSSSSPVPYRAIRLFQTVTTWLAPRQVETGSRDKRHVFLRQETRDRSSLDKRQVFLRQETGHPAVDRRRSSC
uniref:Uncharacterized protein n=1 Tax=Steinernema glaseri TaxID=37863 RepID=A0A1I7XWE8_9BILA